jgi:DNA-binding NarL/FixJ family response regulator
VLIVESDRALAGLFADVIATNCPGLRIDACTLEERDLFQDNVGGADVVVCSCGSGAGSRFHALREIMTLRSCSTVLVLVPADMPELADEAIEAGAADVLLRAPGYLEQLPVAVRKNVAKARQAIAADAREDGMRGEMITIRREIALLRTELAEASHRPAMDRSMEGLPLPVITRTHTFAKAA